MKAKGNHPGKGLSSGGSPSSHVRASELPERVVDFLVGRGSSAAGRFHTLALEGDASDRHYFRLVPEGSSGERPDSYVLMQVRGSRRVAGGSFLS